MSVRRSSLAALSLAALSFAGCAMFILKLLGGASVERSGTPVPGRAARGHRLALLALLARGRPLSRDRVLALLYPESDTDRDRRAPSPTAFTSFRQPLERLRVARCEPGTLSIHPLLELCTLCQVEPIEERPGTGADGLLPLPLIEQPLELGDIARDHFGVQAELVAHREDRAPCSTTRTSRPTFAF